MKRTVKLISLAVVLGALIAAYLIYSSYAKKQNSDDENDAVDTSVEVLAIKSDSISSIKYEYAEEEVDLKKTDGVWRWADDDDFPLDQSYPKDMVNQLSYIVATRLIADNLDAEGDYGLAEPNLTVGFATTDGKEYVYSIGAYNSVANGFYFKLNTEDKIYLIGDGALDAFTYYKLEMIETEALPSVDAESVVSLEYVIDGKTFVLTTDDSEADFYSDPYTYFIKSEDGKLIPADGAAAAELIEAATGLRLSGATDYKPDGETLEGYGLSEGKRIKITVNYEKAANNESDSTVVVKTKESYSFYLGVGETDESTVKYYATLDDSYIIYSVSSSAGEGFFTAMDAKFESKLVCPVSSDDAVSFKIEIGDDKVYFYNISDMDSNDRILNVFNKLTCLTARGETDGEKGELIFKTTFDLGEKEVVLYVFEYDEEYRVASFDKRDNLLISAESADEILKALQ